MLVCMLPDVHHVVQLLQQLWSRGHGDLEPLVLGEALGVARQALVSQTVHLGVLFQTEQPVQGVSEVVDNLHPATAKPLFHLVVLLVRDLRLPLEARPAQALLLRGEMLDHLPERVPVFAVVLHCLERAAEDFFTKVSVAHAHNIADLITGIA